MTSQLEQKFANFQCLFEILTWIGFLEGSVVTDTIEVKKKPAFMQK